MLLKIAWRNIWRNKRRSLITMSSITLGLAIGLLSTAMSDGSYSKLINMAVRMGAGHLTFQNPQFHDSNELKFTLTDTEAIINKVKSIEGVRGFSRRVSAPAMLSSSYGTVGCSFDAVDPAMDREISLLVNKIEKGKYLTNDRPEGVIIGSEVARKLRVDIGQKVVLTAQDKENQTRQELLKVIGIFQTGTDVLDGFYFQMNIAKADEVLGLEPDEVTALGVYLDDLRLIEPVKKQIFATGVTKPQHVKLYEWNEIIPDLANYIAVDNASNYIFQLLIFLVIVAGVLNTVLTSVLERRYEFGVLLSLGFRPFKLFLLIILECAIIALAGISVGSALGWAENWYFHEYPIDLTSFVGGDLSIGGFGMDPRIITDLFFENYVITIVIALSLILMVGIYPALKAATVEPVKALRSID